VNHSEDEDMAGALDGIRVLELNRVAPGSFCTMMLGDMGAEVIKIETPPQAGAEKHFDAKQEDIWVLSEYTNRNKKSVTLNLKDPSAQGIFQEMAAKADVVVEGFRPGVTARLGADYATLSQINPRLVYCSLSGFGQDGPYKDKAAHDLNYLAISGMLNQIGGADGPPPIPLNVIGDYAGATMHGVIGILLALFARQSTGRGQHVDVSYLDTSFALLAAVPGIRNFFIGGPEPHRGENVFSGDQAYYTVYPTQDGKWFSVGCMEPWLWNNFCDALQRPDLKKYHLQTDDFQNPASDEQRQVKTELDAIMQTKTCAQWVDFFADVDVCVGEVNGLGEEMSDPQLQHREMIVPVDDERLSDAKQPGISIKLSDTPGKIHSRPPKLGEHTDEIIADLGRSLEQIADLRSSGVI